MGGESSPRNASRSQRSQTAGSATRESGSSGWPGARGSGGRVGGTADRASPHGRVPQPRGGARRPPGSAADGRGARRGVSIVDLRAAGMVPPAGQSERRRGSERATAGWTRLGSRTGTGGSPRARVHLRAAAGTCAQQFLPRIHKKTPQIRIDSSLPLPRGALPPIHGEADVAPSCARVPGQCNPVCRQTRYSATTHPQAEPARWRRPLVTAGPHRRH